VQLAPAQSLFSWSGLYLGFHAGGAWGTTHVSDPFGPSIFGDSIKTSGGLIGGQAGVNYQIGAVVFGAEAELSWADLDGSNTCFAFSGSFISANCQVHGVAQGTLTGRLGLTTGPQGRTLLYAKGGAAWEYLTLEAGTNAGFGTSSAGSAGKLGWTAGGGIEHAVTGNWSVRAEYDYLAFGDTRVVTPATLMQIAAGNPGSFIVVPNTLASASHDVHQVKVGLNYKFGGDPTALSSDNLATPGRAYELGARYWASTSRLQKDIDSPSLLSRLTYDDVDNRSGEVFGRADLSSATFVKGFVGVGSTASGQMNDEDWGIPADRAGGILAFVPYSNTLQGKIDGGISYATADLGYAWVKTPAFAASPFLGLNLFRQTMDSYGCVQVANANGPCGNASFPSFPTSVRNITEQDTWGALRVGTALDFALANRLKLSADMAYLPFVLFHGVDQHFFLSSGGTTVGHEFSDWGYGRGMQLEAVLSYAITEQFSVGVGARYWSMWATNKVPDAFNASIESKDIHRNETMGAFLQGSYKFGEACCSDGLR
jgi:opacity protein-like surface antigen